jgi:hypothetical protein
MFRLKPPEQLLKDIGYKETETLGLVASPKGIRVKMDVRTYTSKKFYGIYSAMFIAAIKEHFEGKIIASGIDGREMEAFLNYIILAVSHNAAKHGNQNDPQKKIILGWWFGEKGALIGIRDEGDFYQRASIRAAINLRKRLPSGKNPSDFDIIYEADNVSISDGALFVTVLINSLIFPKRRN